MTRSSRLERSKRLLSPSHEAAANGALFALVCVGAMTRPHAFSSDALGMCKPLTTFREPNPLLYSIVICLGIWNYFIS